MAQDEVEIDLKGIAKKVTKGIAWLKSKPYIVPVLLLIIALFFSAYFRMYPMHLPVTDDWAEQTIVNNLQVQIADQVAQQYPNLPEANRQQIVQRELQTVLNDNRQAIEPQKRQIANMFREHLSNPEGGPYLVAIDPYLWYGYGKNYLECGHPGCYVIENESGTYYATLRDGRNYQTPRMGGEAYLGVFIYHIINVFGNYNVMTAFFFIPIVFISLSMFPAFFLGRRLGGNVGGFVAAMIIALNGALLARTPGGFADNDGAIIMFPLYLIWCLVCFMEATCWKKRALWAAGGALSLYLMSWIWPTQHVVAILGASLALYFAILIISEYLKHKNFKKVYTTFKQPILTAASFVAVFLATMTIFVDWRYILNLFEPIMGFIRFHEVAVRTAWPNVLTTVAELNVQPYSALVSQMGGSFIVGLAFVGAALMFFARDEHKKRHLLLACFVLVWGVATAFSFSRGVRFGMLVIPSVAICAGVAVGLAYRYATKWMIDDMKANALLARSILGVFIVLFFVLPITPSGSLLTTSHNIALNQIPSYNDAWDNTLNAIKADAEDGYGYITTWWDFGHWFVAKGIRVTFDGGDQGRRIHWVGNALLTDDEDTSVGLIRMLNCGQENGPNLLEEYLENDTLRAVTLTYETIVEDRDTARQILQDAGINAETIEQYLEYTHCDADIRFPQYFITSEDMVGKAGVWGHFGSWNFTRATMYQQIRGSNLSTGTQILMEQYEFDQQTAQRYHREIQQTRADQWVAGWPGYYSGRLPCARSASRLSCQAVSIDLETMTGTASLQEGTQQLYSIAYINDSGDFEVVRGNESIAQVSVLLFPDDSIMLVDPLQAGSMFTRLFFFGGHGLRHFERFHDEQQLIGGGRITTWKVNWDGIAPIDVEDDLEVIDVPVEPFPAPEQDMGVMVTEEP